MIAAVRLVGTFVRRDFAIARSYRFPFWIQLVASGGILLVVNRVSALVDPHRGADPALRAGFFAYVLVGMAVIQFVTACLTAFAAKLREEQVTGTFAALATTPAPLSVVALSLAAYEVLQGVVASVVLLGLGAAAGADFDVSSETVVVAGVTLIGLLAVALGLGVLLAAFTVVFKRGTALGGLVLAAVMLFSGVYFPTAGLPPWVRWAADASPITWGITALRRALLLDGVDGVRIAGLFAAALVLVPLSLVVFRRAVDRARRDGTLEQY